MAGWHNRINRKAGGRGQIFYRLTSIFRACADDLLSLRTSREEAASVVYHKTGRLRHHRTNI